MDRKKPEQTTTIGEIIKGILKENGMSQLELANALGHNSQSAIAERLRGDIRIGTAVKLLNYLGYEIVVREIGKKKGGEVIREINKASGREEEEKE